MAAAYRSGYEGAGAGDRRTGRRASDGDVVDDAVEGDPRAPRGRDETAASRERSTWRHGMEGGERLVRGRPGRGHGDGRGRVEGARWAHSKDGDIDRREDRGREDVGEERERGGYDEQERGVRGGSGESGERGGRLARSEGYESGERGDVEESRDRRERRGSERRGDGGRWERQSQDRGSEREEDGETFGRATSWNREGVNVPTDDGRRMQEARSKERLDHDLARDTGRGPFKRMKETLKGMAKARPADRKPEPPRYKESDDWNHFWGSGG